MPRSSPAVPLNGLGAALALALTLGLTVLTCRPPRPEPSAGDPKLLLLNDPTKGVDVGAKGEFYQLLAELRAAGTAVLFYSSDDDELLSLISALRAH